MPDTLEARVKSRKRASGSIKIAIIDYEMSNLFSVAHACDGVGMKPILTTNKDEIMSADGVIMPGVGAFGAAMSNLKRLDLIAPIMDLISSGKPFMGICLGMQLLMTESEEFGIHKGLNIIEGSVKRFSARSDNGKTYKVPQVGWNRITHPPLANAAYWDKTPLRNIEDGEYMYFVNSYFVTPRFPDNVLSISNYSVPYASAVVKGNIFGFQFHPEKSGQSGIKMYRNFRELIESGIK